MTIGQLRETVAGILEKPLAAFRKGSGDNTVDLLLVSLNNARIKAERQFNFSELQTYAELALPVGGASWRTATQVSDDEVVRIRTVKNWYLRTNGVDTPLRLITKNLLAILTKQQDYNYGGSSVQAMRYPGDGDLLSPVFSSYLVQSGTRVDLHPPSTTALTLRMDAYKWADAYTSDADEDWFCLYGSDYLMWQAVVEANYLTGSFAMRSEGGLPPPTQLAKEAFESMIMADDEAEAMPQTPEFF